MSPSELRTGWTELTGVDALPSIGVWANVTGGVWSPDVNQLVSGSRKSMLHHANILRGQWLIHHVLRG